MKIYVINLPRNSDRRQFMIDQFSKLGIINYEFVDGVDPRSVDISTVFDKESFIANHQREAVLGEIGCYLAHGDVLQKIAYSGEAGLILEDDIIIDGSIHNLLNNPLLKYPSFDLIFLNRPVDGSFIKQSNSTLIPLTKEDLQIVPWGSLSYIVSNTHAKTLHENHLPMKVAYDGWHTKCTRKYFATSKVYCAITDEFVSTIEYRDVNSPNFGKLEGTF